MAVWCIYIYIYIYDALIFRARSVVKKKVVVVVSLMVYAACVCALTAVHIM